jgi:phosphoribosylaminoimidazolecarboxamide formyltransferase / IMP cyclohydrolase
VRAAAKNFQDVLVVVNPADYPQVLEQLARPGGPSPEFRLSLMQKAFEHTAMYDGMIAMTMKLVEADGGKMRRRPLRRTMASAGNFATARTRTRRRTGRSAAELRPPWQVHQGKELSYTNLLDLDAAVRIALEFDEPAAVVIKHTNPCGVATGSSAADAYVRARDADALSAFGGIVSINRPWMSRPRAR